MSLSSGTRLGPYEVLAPLGAGGMGEVYKAKDTRLDRTVAIKVLPAHLSENLEFKQRFEREARAISQLSHPHICALYDVGSQDGVEYLVMELLEGQTVAERLEKGAFAIDQVLKFGIQIADALDRAHRAGIIHRDLKPANIMLTKPGVKLLDFGLAKFSAPPEAAAELSSLPTEAGAAPLTERGTVMGTFQYMAPEQLEGCEADGRTDIFSFGCVLYEMATGRKAFSGSSRASLIGAIMNTEPPLISSIQPMTPPAFERVVKTCLAKDPDERWQSAHDVESELKWIAGGGAQVGLPPPVAARRKMRERIAYGVTALSVLVSVLLLFGTSRQAASPEAGLGAIRSTILLPEGARMVSSPALSPDGKRLVFVATGSDGKQLLWVRPLASSEARPLPGTEGGSFPFWSPDGQLLGFFAEGKLKKIAAAGGPADTVCDASDGRGGAWGPDGTILFSPHMFESIYRVSATGGPVSAVTRLDKSRGEISHRWPVFLPDGRHFLFYGMAPRQEAGVRLGSLDSTQSRLLLPSATNALYSTSGHLLFVKEGNLMAQRFDAKSLTLSGDALPVAEKAGFSLPFRRADTTVAGSDALVYRVSTPVPSRIVWMDRGGRELASPGETAYYQTPRLSMDGRRFLAVRLDPRTQEGDYWLYDSDRGGATRLTADSDEVFAAIWSPDGREIVFDSSRAGLADLYRKEANGAGPETTLLRSSSYKIPCDWSPDGRFILYAAIDPRFGWDIWMLPLAGGQEPVAFVASPFLEHAARFSPSGHFVAYVSNESGRLEVYVRPFPGPGGAERVSSGGGQAPAWRRNGKELYYVAPDGGLVAVQVQEGGRFSVGGSTKLGVRVQSPGLGLGDYDVSPDGQRFLVRVPVEKPPEPSFTLVLNWTAELGKR